MNTTTEGKESRLSDAELGRKLREGLAGAKTLVLSMPPARRDSSVVLAYMAGFLEEDREVSALLGAFSCVSYRSDALGDGPVAAAPAWAAHG